MVLVDIYVPAVGNMYDFQLDEEEKVGAIIEEIAGLVGQKERCELIGDLDRLMLCSKESRQILPRDMTLAAAGLHNGSSLVLV